MAYLYIHIPQIFSLVFSRNSSLQPHWSQRNCACPYRRPFTGWFIHTCS